MRYVPRSRGWLSASGFLGLALVTAAAAQPAHAFLPAGGGTQDYQIGSEWGKKEVTAQSLQRESAVFQRAALAAARYGATSFYLGKFNGRHVMATNHHVVEAYACTRRAEFLLARKSYPCTKIYVDLPEIDLALFSIDVPASDEAALKAVGRNFAFDKDIYPGQELVTVGYGTAGNFTQKTMGNQDSDCKVFSGRNEFRLMADPDQFNPADYRAWSFANGCDVSHGDSGSAFVDRRTGDVVGIVWTGAIPKRAAIQSSLELDKILQNQSEEIWKDLTFAVPAAKIFEVLNRYLDTQPALDAETRATLQAVLRNQAE